MKKLNELGAREAVQRLLTRDISAVDLASACLERIAERESIVGAWIHLDPEAVRAQARKLDTGPVRGPLHGLPLGVKDIIDTADMPTACGSPIYAGHRPAAPRAARPPRSPMRWCRSPSAPRPRARSCGPRATAASSATSRATPRSRAPASSCFRKASTPLA